MTTFTDEDLTRSRFDTVDLSGSRFVSCSLSDTFISSTDFHRVVMRGVELLDVTIEGEIENLTINGVDVGPLVEAELDRRQPLRVKMRPTDPAGFREAWLILDDLWAATLERARALDRNRLHESVNGEWSFIETLRHLCFATDAWVRRVIQGDPSPWHPLDLPWDQMPDTPGIPRDRGVQPSLEEVLVVRRDRVAGVQAFVDGLTDESLAAQTEPVDGPGWPASRSFSVRECLLLVLNEEWHHRRFAERDLDALDHQV